MITAGTVARAILAGGPEELARLQACVREHGGTATRAAKAYRDTLCGFGELKHWVAGMTLVIRAQSAEYQNGCKPR